MAKKRILIIDDSETQLAAYRKVFKLAKFDVVTAADGRDGLEKARSLELDIILMNIMLPKLNGYKVCQLIKFDEKFTHIPVILLSSRDKYLDADIIRDSGADVYFEKTASPSASFFANLVEQANQKTETTPLIQGL